MPTLVSLKSERSLASRVSQSDKSDIVDFLRSLEVKESFETPHSRGLAHCSVHETCGLIGYDGEGLKKYDIVEG